MPEAASTAPRADDPARSAMPPTPVRELTVLGFDFGSKRIGAAVGNGLTGTATPLRTVRAERSDATFDAIAALIREWQPQQLVVGLPLHPDGTPHDVTRRAQRFARQLQGRFGLPVALVDERYTSVAAQDAGADDVDAAAAQLIVEQYLRTLPP